ncbi:MAG: methyltransferase domain-containing protein [Planctomycetota bacterium]|nr:methyltransferase domain-containing protein [Planctomycetales bacterium]RLT02781.1 MAG: methyltransferase domain-containing protein [Planctomycetota bacterium]
MALLSIVTDSRESTEASVYERYAAASRQVEPALCCPVQYAGQYLKVVPQEIIDKDYGCGDPSAWVNAGDTVLDLGSGTGKLCYIMSQVVGPQGKVIGVDCNIEMLELSRKYRDEVAGKIGYSNVEFRYGLIQDLQLDLDLLNSRLAEKPVQSSLDWIAGRQVEAQLRKERPLIADNSMDCVVSNCVLNLVRQQDRRQLFNEIFRVLKPGGRAVISDIVSDETVPEHMQQDGYLWSGCLSGAFREDLFLEAFADAGFHGITLEKRQAEPWQTIEGIEFRSMTVMAWKGKDGPCLERNQAVVYKGPFRRVEDDDGHLFVRGQRMAVCEKLTRLVQLPPYAGMFETIEPHQEIPVDAAQLCDCRCLKIRDPKETKGRGYNATMTATGSCCNGDESCG